MIKVAVVLLATSTLHTVGFHTPSRNIICDSFGGGGPGRGSMRCDINNTSNRPKPKPRSCEFDYGFSYGLSTRGRGELLCVSDAVVNTRPILRYGRAWSRFGMRCVSRRSGLTCRNGRGHGFFLSRGRQRVF